MWRSNNKGHDGNALLQKKPLFSFLTVLVYIFHDCSMNQEVVKTREYIL